MQDGRQSNQLYQDLAGSISIQGTKSFLFFPSFLGLTINMQQKSFILMIYT